MMRRIRWPLTILAMVGGVIAAFAGGPRGIDDVIIDWFTIDGGGGAISGASGGITVEIEGTIGQPDAGFHSGQSGSTTVEITAGFWAVAAGGDHDCDLNGQSDACEIDCEAEGCDPELPCGEALDCNSNGVPDDCEVISGGASDCNGNGIPEECDLANGVVPDCEPNGIPDTCEPDCDTDSLTDACEIVAGIPDNDENGVPDPCEAPKVFSNWVRIQSVGSWDTAANWSPAIVPDNDTSGDPDQQQYFCVVIRPSSPKTVTGSTALDREVLTLEIGAETGETNTLAVSSLRALSTLEGFLIDSGGRVNLLQGSLIGGASLRILTGGTLASSNPNQAAAEVAADLVNEGSVTVLASHSLNLSGNQVSNLAGGTLDVDGSVAVLSPQFVQQGMVSINGVLSFENAPLVNEPGGTIELVGGELFAYQGLENLCGGLISLSGAFGGQINGDIINDGEIFVNSQSAATFNGDLTVTGCGTLTGDGEFVITGSGLDLILDGGDLELNGQSGDDSIVLESLTIAAAPGDPANVVLDDVSVDVTHDIIIDDSCSGAGLVPRGCSEPVLVISPNTEVALGGHFDNQVESPAPPEDFDWSGELIMNGGGGVTVQGIEAAGRDLGPDADGLVDNFAMAMLTVAGGADVQVVDDYDNPLDGLSKCDALYVGVLNIEPGASLSSDGCPLYYGTLAEGSLMPTDPMVIAFHLLCEGDANGDGIVDPLDAGYVLARFGCAVGEEDASCDAADVNGDGSVDPLDSGYVLARFGVCP